MFSIVILGVLGIVAIYFLCFKKDSSKRYPPGPWGLPILGHVLSLGSKPHLSLMELAKRHGPIFTCNLGMDIGIVIDDLDMMKEIFSNPIYTGRPDNKIFSITAGGKHGIISSDGDEWVEQRRFTLRQLRDFGFGKKSMESLIMEEVQELLDWMKKQVGKPVSLNRKFSLAVLNSLWTILTGQRFDQDDPELNRIFDTAMQSFNEIGSSAVAVFMPSVAEVFPNFFGWNKMMKSVNALLKFFRDTVEEHEKFPGDSDNPRDFIDVYFNEIRKTTNKESSFYGEAGRRSLLAVVADLHGAGSETTSTTLAWSILYLITHPEVQKKLQREIDQIVGKSRLPCLANKPKMPYTECVMYEVFRKSSIAPLGLFRNTMVDSEFRGYFIPKNTIVQMNFYSVHHNLMIWGDPENFRPERFLSPDGKSSVKHEALIPFGGGKRACLGETLARDEFFLFLVGIFQHFEVQQDPNAPSPSLEHEAGFILAPEKFTVIVKERES